VASPASAARSSVARLRRYGERTDFAARAYFFLACVLIAGVYGSLTAKGRILYMQALPAAAALAAVWLS
jgi:uncharacterized membrane protein